MSDATSKKSQTQTLYMGEDEKEKIFANLEFIEDKCTNISFYVIRKKNK